MNHPRHFRYNSDMEEITLRQVMSVIYQLICQAKALFEREFGFGKKK